MHDQAQIQRRVPVTERSTAAVLDLLNGRIQPVKVGPLYQLALLGVAVTMLVLPAIYVALIIAAGYCVVLYASEGASIFSSVRSVRGALLIYLGPLVIGAILLFFMIKPLFARKEKTHFPLTIDRHEEPLLFAFVDRLCDIVRAPRPRRIDVDTQVNASASFASGVGGLLGKQLVLTIGMPLAAGLTLREFAGVLAHEFGHFGQGSGMRLSYVIRRVNLWFARVVYERDSWDAWLAHAGKESGNAGIMLVLLVAQFFVWLTRRVLWCLMMTGHGVSAILMRQMEFDADQYECRVAGPDAFKQTFERIAMLSLAQQAAMNDLGDAWREKRLADDLPALVQLRESEMPAEIRDVVRKHAAERKSGWFDTHPSTAARIAAGTRNASSGLLQKGADVPASALFAEFADLARRATASFYQQTIGPAVRPENLVSTGDLLAARGKRRANYQALERFFAGLVDAKRPVFPGRIPDLPQGRDRDAAAERLLELRSAMYAAAPSARTAAKTYDAAAERCIGTSQIREQRTAGVAGKINPTEFGLAAGTGVDDGTLAALERTSRQERDDARAQVDSVLYGAVERLRLALSLEPIVDGASPPAEVTPAPSPLDEDDPNDYGAYEVRESTPEESRDDRILSALRAIQDSAVDTARLHTEFILMGTLLSKVKSDNNPKSLVEAVLFHSRRLVELLRTVHTALMRAQYPYEHADGRVTLSVYAASHIPNANQPGDAYEAAESTLEAIYGVYVRMMSDLAIRAERVEEYLGLPPMSIEVETQV